MTALCRLWPLALLLWAQLAQGQPLHLRLGPGEAYPAYHHLRPGEPLRLLQRRSGWVQVQTAAGVRGWVPAAALGLSAAGAAFAGAGLGRLAATPVWQIHLGRRHPPWRWWLEWREGSDAHRQRRLLAGGLARQWRWRRLEVRLQGGLGQAWRLPRPGRLGLRPARGLALQGGLGLHWHGAAWHPGLQLQRHRLPGGEPAWSWAVLLEAAL